MELDRAKLRPAPGRMSRATAPDGAQELDALMGAIQAGERHAYAALVGRITPLLRQVARNRGVAAADLDDVVQETLLALHRSKDSYDPARPVLPWLVGITRHCVRDRWRQDMREGRRRLALRTLHCAWAAESADGGANVGLLAESLSSFIAALPPAQREAIELVAIARMDLRAASEATGRSAGAIKVNLHRAREALHQRLTAGGDDARPRRSGTSPRPGPVP